MIQTIKTAIAVIAMTLVAFSLAHSQLHVEKNKSLSLVGINIAGAEFGADHLPGIFGQDYFYPERSSIDYFSAQGINCLRLPVLWERIQPRLGQALDEPEMRRIDSVVDYATAKGLRIIIDVHNYAKYFKSVIGAPDLPPTALGDLWHQIAMRYKQNNLVIFGLMNEPTQLHTETWLVAANDAIAKIRLAGAGNLILVPGNGWSSARDWMSTKYGTPNGQVMLNVVDPNENFVFDVHQYFDRDFTGTHAECQNIEIGVNSLKRFTRWAREHSKRGFLGEFGAGSNSICLDALDRVLKFMAANNDVWFGWAYWAGGPMWSKDYFTNIEPLDGQDRPQMSVLKKYIGNGRSR